MQGAGPEKEDDGAGVRASTSGLRAFLYAAGVVAIAASAAGISYMQWQQSLQPTTSGQLSKADDPAKPGTDSQKPKEVASDPPKPKPAPSEPKPAPSEPPAKDPKKPAIKKPRNPDALVAKDAPAPVKKKSDDKKVDPPEPPAPPPKAPEIKKKPRARDMVDPVAVDPVKPPVKDSTPIKKRPREKDDKRIVRPQPRIVPSDPGAAGGFIVIGSSVVPLVVDPNRRIRTMDNVFDLNNYPQRYIQLRPKDPIPDNRVKDWERLLASLLLEIVDRKRVPNDPQNVVGPLQANSANLAGLTFVRRGVNGNVTNRLQFVDSKKYVLAQVAAPGTTGAAAPDSGTFSITDQLLTLTSASGAGNVRRLSISKFRQNANGLRTIQLGADPWEQELAATPATGTIALTEPALRGKSFLRTNVGVRQRLTFLPGGAFVYVNAPLDHQRGTIPMQVVRGTYVVSGANLNFVRQSTTAFPAPLTDSWPTGPFTLGADGKHTLTLNREEWEEERPVPDLPLGPIDASSTTLRGVTFVSIASPVNVPQRLELKADGTFTFKAPPFLPLATGTYTATKSNLSLTFSQPLPRFSGFVASGIWPITDYQANANGKRTIRIQCFVVPTGTPPASASTLFEEEP